MKNKFCRFSYIVISLFALLLPFGLVHGAGPTATDLVCIECVEREELEQDSVDSSKIVDESIQLEDLAFVPLLQPQGLRILSIDPLSVLLRHSAILSEIPFSINLPGSNSRSEFLFGFTIPDDYSSNGPLLLTLLVQSSDANSACNYVLKTAYLSRSRADVAKDLGNASSGLDPLDASTNYVYSENEIAEHPNGREIAFASPLDKTAEVRFTIDGGTSDFAGNLQSGDGIIVGIFREVLVPEDTCDVIDLHIVGISIQYD